MPGARILLVEDEGIVARDLQSRLTELGYEVCGWVTSGEAAVRAAAELAPQLVLMDIRIKGGLDGIEAAEEISRHRHIPVIFLTAHSDPETLRRAARTQPFGYLLKPFDERELRITIEVALVKHAADAELRLLNATLEEQRRYLTTLLEAIPLAVLVVDAEGRVEDMNRGMERTFGHSAGRLVSELFGDAVRCVTAVDCPGECGSLRPCSQCGVRTAIHEAMAGREVRRRRAEFHLADHAATRAATLLISAAPLDHGGVRRVLLVVEDVTELDGLRALVGAQAGFAGIVGRSPRMQEIYQTIDDVAELSCAVLIHGESGTGKELVARAIHSQGPRAEHSFVPVNCAALPEGLLESELFGHVKGAFTGAVRDKKGRFELANHGTIFLDEVGELSQVTQVKLLRVLQEQCFERVGGERPVSVDVRVVSATNRDLRQEIAAGRFREDLFYRLCVVPMELPPLRERLTDLPLLADHILERSATLSGRPKGQVSQATVAALMDHAWPGNVRELQNAIEYALIKSRGAMIEPDHLPPSLGRSRHGEQAPARANGSTLDQAVVAQAIAAAGGNKKQAARDLGVSRATLYRHLKRSGPS